MKDKNNPSSVKFDWPLTNEMIKVMYFEKVRDKVDNMTKTFKYMTFDITDGCM